MAFSHSRFTQNPKAMKKILLFCVFSIGFSILTQAQQLQYSTWTRIAMYFNEQVFQHVNLDSCTNSSPDGVLVSSTYTEEGNVFTIQDVTGPFACSDSIVGTYTFTIVDGTTLYFTLVEDACSTRANSLTEGIFTRMPPKTIHIPADFPHIQQGIVAADNTDTVLVDPGTYYENINFLGKKPLMVASRFIVDGDTNHISNTIINGSQPLDPDIGSVVTFESGEDTTSVLCGFTITGGTGTMEPSVDMRFSGGIHIKYAGGKLLNNYVHDNTVTHSGAVAGGGMQLGGPVSVIPWIVLRGNRIYNNHATSTSNFAGGGGVICYYNLIMENNNISNNEINGHQFVLGGGMVCYGEFGPIELRIHHNTFSHNKAITDQGAFGLAGGGGGIQFDENCWGTINNNIISFNTIEAPDLYGSYGPGVYVQYNKDGLVFGNNIIEGNSTISQNTSGGGLSLCKSGGVYQNNVIRNNTANKGGGVSILDSYSASAKAIFINNTITGNDLFGLHIRQSQVVVINSILYNNTPP